MPRSRSPRVAIVSDPLVQRVGAERFVEVMAQTFPDAPIFAILYSEDHGPASLAPRVHPSGLARIPGAARRHRWFLPFYPGAVESFDLAGYDVILSSHHTAAKGILRSARQHHICYCHTPMRALWERPFEELQTLPAPVRPLAAAMLGRLRTWDVATVSRVDEFVANSETTRARIAKHYGRQSLLLHPPIDVSHFTPQGPAVEADYYLVASRLVPYKRIDLAVAATAALGRRLIVVGTGPGRDVLGAPHVEYRGHVSDGELVALMRGARAMLFPAFEDFGMAPVEMMACGRPVAAYGAGGACETIIDGVTGVFAGEQTIEAFVDAISRLERLPFDRARIRAHAETFGHERFSAMLTELVNAAWERLERPTARPLWMASA